MDRSSKWLALLEEGKYGSLTEDPQAAMFLPVLQSPTSLTTLVGRTNRDQQQLVAAIRSKVHDEDETQFPIVAFVTGTMHL